jgi:hypothetical protein
MATPDPAKLDRIVAEARRAADARALTYREQALKIYPWICGRCARELTRTNLRELTVHHRDHNHDNNPPDGSSWELLCLYCTPTSISGSSRRRRARAAPAGAAVDLFTVRGSQGAAGDEAIGEVIVAAFGQTGGRPARRPGRTR